ncbi:MAG TPA: SIR2 family protein [Candidatus Binatia bacterium]
MNGRWLPTVGAGLSRNAVTPDGKPIPLWSELGDQVNKDLGDYSPTGPIDALSAFEHEFGRPKLIERLADLLRVDIARPGDAHKAFCKLPFELVCTTNFDFLLERQYEIIPRHCTPLIEEDQLSVNLDKSGTGLLKLHGDLNHPTRLVVTEADYDSFLERFPLLATFLANLLITRTAVLIGYSLDDPDFRQIWQVVGERLGRSRRIAYVIMVGAKPSDIARFERRGVKTINLPGSRNRYGEVLTSVFNELYEYWQERVIPASRVREEEPLRQLSLPRDANTRLCYFAIPLALEPFYRERVFPIVREVGFVPVTADDIVSPGDNIIAKIDALLERALLAVVEAATAATLSELQLAMMRLGSERVLVITPEGSRPPIQIGQPYSISRPEMTTVDPVDFLMRLREWFEVAAKIHLAAFSGEPSRLLMVKAPTSRVVSLRQMLDFVVQQGLVSQDDTANIIDWLRIRNEAVHSRKVIQRDTAEEIVSGVLAIVKRMNDQFGVKG